MRPECVSRRGTTDASLMCARTVPHDPQRYNGTDWRGVHEDSPRVPCMRRSIAIPTLARAGRDSQEDREPMEVLYGVITVYAVLAVITVVLCPRQTRAERRAHRARRTARANRRQRHQRPETDG